MKHETLALLLKNLQIASLFTVGEGLMTASELVKKSGVSYATTYRYLSKMLDMGYVKVKPYKCRNLQCYKYRISSSGRDFLANIGELPALEYL